MSKKISILVTGACGSIGYEIIKIAAGSNSVKTRTFDLVTSKNKAKLKKHPELEVMYGDLRDPFKVWLACQGIDYVIHLGALIPPAADNNPDLARQINVEGTRNIINALNQGNRNARILYASSISIYGDRVKTPWIKKSDPLNPSEGDYYAQTKIESERLIRESGLDYSIFRVSAVMGSQTKLNPLFFHMPLGTSLEIITAHDAGNAFLKAINNFNPIRNQIFNLSGGTECRITYKGFLDKVFSIQGLKNLNLPSKAFASKNFHCGYYEDGDELEELLHFRSENLTDYFFQMAERQTVLSRGLASLLNPVIRMILLKQSDPWKAFRKGSGKPFKHFFLTSE
ncbi:MAG: NAD(P)-dependent oxidoreductase [Bacteroidota bacterium]|nr:NAD(P)-dependent oxidoreductase [Bacteroidota bacterium]